MLHYRITNKQIKSTKYSKTFNYVLLLEKRVFLKLKSPLLQSLLELRSSERGRQRIRLDFRGIRR